MPRNGNIRKDSFRLGMRSSLEAMFFCGPVRPTRNLHLIPKRHPCSSTFPRSTLRPHGER